MALRKKRGTVRQEKGQRREVKVCSGGEGGIRPKKHLGK